MTLVLFSTAMQARAIPTLPARAAPIATKLSNSGTNSTEDGANTPDDAATTSVANLPNNATPNVVPNGTSNQTNQANNPITPKLTLNLQNYFTPRVEGFGTRMVDEELLRFYVPFKLFGVQNMVRFYQPIFKDPLFPQGKDAGLGDTTIYDLTTANVGHTTLGAGPLLVLPDATHGNMGAGKWQAGAAGVAVREMSWGLAGTVVTYQHSFAGDASRKSDQLFTVQPILRYNMKKGLYLRSTGFWNLNFDDHISNIPIGLGVGKVWKMRDKTTVNLYVEPQYSVYQNGIGSPRTTILMGLNFQWASRKARAAAERASQSEQDSGIPGLTGKPS